MNHDDDVMLVLVLAIIREHLRLWGDLPTPAQLRALLQRAGA